MIRALGIIIIMSSIIEGEEGIMEVTEEITEGVMVEVTRITETITIKDKWLVKFNRTQMQSSKRNSKITLILRIIRYKQAIRAAKRKTKMMINQKEKKRKRRTSLNMINQVSLTQYQTQH